MLLNKSISADYSSGHFVDTLCRGTRSVACRINEEFRKQPLKNSSVNQIYSQLMHRSYTIHIILMAYYFGAPRIEGLIYLISLARPCPAPTYCLCGSQSSQRPCNQNINWCPRELDKSVRHTKGFHSFENCPSGLYFEIHYRPQFLDLFEALV
jgi:hypothetical protein